MNFNRRRIYSVAGIIILLLLFLIFGIVIYRNISGEVVKTALSPDAHYALTTDAKNFAIVWNLQNRTKKIISRDANMYSAYWIDGTSDYVWQSLKDKKVHIIDNNTGKEIRTFTPGILAYGQAVSSNLKNYVMSDWDWNIYLYQNGQRYQLARMFTSGTFEGANKIINFTFLGSDQILASGMAYPTGDMLLGPKLWDLSTKKVLNKFIGNMVQTFATISPDGKYVVAGDMNGGNLFVWDVKGEKQKVASWGNEPVTDYTKYGVTTDTNVIAEPKDYYQHYNIMSIKYIDADHYLVFFDQSKYVTLYQTLNPKPIKYLDLGTTPWPATFNLERDQSMDTSPSAHILVMAKDQEPGIMVYHYDPKKQTLEKVWDGN